MRYYDNGTVTIENAQTRTLTEWLSLSDEEWSRQSGGNNDGASISDCREQIRIELMIRARGWK